MGVSDESVAITLCKSAEVWGEDPPRFGLPGSGDGEWAMPDARWQVHRSEDSGGYRANPARQFQTRSLHSQAAKAQRSQVHQLLKECRAMLASLREGAP